MKVSFKGKIILALAAAFVALLVTAAALIHRTHVGQVGDGSVTEVSRIADTVRRWAAMIGECVRQPGRISAVTAVIREIADRTNLPDLNAAIEAARAGEAGTERVAQPIAGISDLLREQAAASEQIAVAVNGVAGATERDGDAWLRVREAVTQVRAVAGPCRSIRRPFYGVSGC